MNRTNIYIAIAAAVLVVLGFTLPWKNLLPRAIVGISTTTPAAELSLPNITIGSLTSLNDNPAGIQAWATFESYIAAAKAHDLPTLSTLSYQLSPACQDEARREECYGLMDSVVFFTGDFKQSHFTHVAFDDKQIVMSTDYIDLPGATAPIKTVFYFVRLDSTHTQFLGIRFCTGKERQSGQCVETSARKRDTNKNGWWDDVEAMFRTN